MATRIRVAWDALAGQLLRSSPIDGMRELRNWVLTSARQVAAPATAYLDASLPVARFVAAAPADLPARQCAWSQLLVAVASSVLPRDPVRFAGLVEGHVAALVVYTIPESACRFCQADLEVWWHPDTAEEVHLCDLLECRWTPAHRAWKGDPGGLVPATRAQITAWRGDGDLIPLRSPS
jgi:hypothetical protein